MPSVSALREDVTHIVDQMADVVTRNRYSVARRAGVSEADNERIRGAFVYGGFGYDLTVRNATALNDDPAEVLQRDDDSAPFP